MASSAHYLAVVLTGFAVLSLSANVASACKDLRYPAHLDRATLDAYETIAVVYVQKITPNGPKNWYEPPFSFSGTIVKPIKGAYKKDDIIAGQTGGPDVGAACPISLKEKSTYILFFYGKQNPVTLARYGSYYQTVQDAKLHPYVRDLLELMSTPGNKSAND